MLIIPAIDLKDGKCVRLKQGRMEDDTVFSDDPVATAQHWVNEGARRLHLVDLNGAFAGTPIHKPVVEDYFNLELLALQMMEIVLLTRNHLKELAKMVAKLVGVTPLTL